MMIPEEAKMLRSLLILIGCLAVLVSNHATGAEPEAKIKPIATVEIKRTDKESAVVSWLGFSNDGKMLVAMHKAALSTHNTQIQILDPLTGKVSVEDEIDTAKSRFRTIFMDPESKWLGMRESSKVKRYSISPTKIEELETWSDIAEGSDNWINPEGSSLYVFNWKRLLRYSLVTKKIEKNVELPNTSSNSFPYFSPDVSIHFDKSYIAVIVLAKGDIYRVEILSLDGKQISRFETPESPSKVQFTPDGKSLAVGRENGVVSFHDVETGKELWKVVNPKDSFTPLGVFFDPQGKHCFFATTGGYINCIDIQKTKIIQSTKVAGNQGMGFFTMSKDGKRLATSSTNIQLWNSEDFTKP